MPLDEDHERVGNHGETKRASAERVKTGVLRSYTALREFQSHLQKKQFDE